MQRTLKISDDQREFCKTDFYKRVIQRKKKLQKKLLEIDREVWAKSLPITKVFEEYDLDVLVGFLQKYQCQNPFEFELDEDSSRVRLIGKKDSAIYDYICVEYFRLYTVSENRTEIQRFSYFELYYDQYVVSCIADANMLKKTVAFDAVHMEGSDWTQAQRQIRLWNKYLLPKIEELPGPSVFFPAGIRERMEGWDRNEHRYFNFQCSCPDISNPLWKVVTYIRLCQLMPILPSASVPWYFVNLVCKNKADKTLLAENLRVFLEAHFQNDPIIRGKVRQSQRLPMDKMFEKESYRAIPVIFLLEKQKDIDQLCDAVSVDDGVSKKSQNHPFRDIIPICISDRFIQDSAVLNIEVQDIVKVSWDTKEFDILTKSFGSILHRYQFYKSKKTIRSWIKAVREEMKRIITDYYCSTGFDAFIRTDLEKRYPKTWELMTWYVLLRKGAKDEFSLADNEKAWLVGVLEDLSKQQNDLETVVDALMLQFRKEFNEREDKRPKVPTDGPPEELVFRTTIKGDSLLCFYPGYFSDWLKAHNVNVDKEDVLDCLKGRELLRRSSNKEHCLGIKLKKQVVAAGERPDIAIDHYAIIMK